ncbi:hypothetical protein AAVH_33548, partial [Aphelenchoides avenae]
MLIQSVTALATTTFIPLQIQPAGPTAATSSVHDNGEQDELKNFRDRKVTEAEGEEEQDLNGQEKNEVAYGMEIEAGEAGGMPPPLLRPSPVVKFSDYLKQLLPANDGINADASHREFLEQLRQLQEHPQSPSGGVETSGAYMAIWKKDRVAELQVMASPNAWNGSKHWTIKPEVQ